MTTIATDFHAPAWRICKDLHHAGVIHSPGEPVPEMTMAEALDYERQGCLVRADAEPNGRVPMSEMTAVLYLSGTDMMVLRRIREFKPNRKMLLEILEIARLQTRSLVLIEALKMKLNLPVEPLGERP